VLLQKRSLLDVGFDPLGSPPRQIIAQTRPEAGAASQASPGLDLRSGRSFVSHYVQPPVPPESTSWPFPAMLDGAVPIWSRRPSASTPARTHGILRGMTAWRAPCLEQAGARLVSQPPAPWAILVSLDGAAADDWSTMRLILKTSETFVRHWQNRPLTEFKSGHSPRSEGPTAQQEDRK
jgi:hypothetical protein